MRFHLNRLLPSIAALHLVVLISSPVQAKWLMRDADMEQMLKQIGAPVLRAAGLNPSRVKILIVEDNTPGTVVVSNEAIVVHDGLSEKPDDAAKFQGVIAQGTAPIANRHLTRQMNNYSNAHTVTDLGIVLAAAAAASCEGRGGITIRAAIDQATAARPNDPFLRAQKGRLLLKTRNLKSAAQVSAQAVQRAPNGPPLLSGAGHALLTSGPVKSALSAPGKSGSQNFRTGTMPPALATPYAKTGPTGMATLITAERSALTGRLKNAGIPANRASGLLAWGSGPWQRAQDVLIATERAAK